jgi:hypothetical protein
VDEFLEKLEADQDRLRDHLRGQILRFQKIGHCLNEIRRKNARLFVIGEGNLDDLSRLIALEFLRQWSAVPVSISNTLRDDFDGVDSASEIIRMPRSVPEKIKELVEHFRDGDMILAFIHAGQSRDLKKALKLAKKAKIRVLAIGGVEARDALRHYCHVFLPLPTRGIKTICEASFICARIIARFARAGKADKQEDLEILESQQKAKEAWGGLKKVGEQAAKKARKKLKDSSGLSDQKTRSRKTGTVKYKRKKTGVLEDRRKRRSASSSSSQQEREGSEEKRQKKKSKQRSKLSQSAEKRNSTERKKRKSARHTPPLQKSSKVPSNQSPSPSAEALEALENIQPALDPLPSPDLSTQQPKTTKSARMRSGQNSADRKSKISSRIKTARAGEEKIIVPESLNSSDVNSLTMSEIESAPSRRRQTPKPDASAELIPPKWLADNESVQEPIGMGSSFKSSGILGDLGLQSDDLMPRYIRDALDPNSIPMPSQRIDAIGDDQETKARFVSNRFRVQECTLRFAFGAFPDELVPEHSLIKLSPTNVAFLLNAEDDAAATLSRGDELWLRIEVPAFFEPILARAAIVGFETQENQSRLRFNLQFTNIDSEHRRKIKIAAQTLAATQ